MNGSSPYRSGREIARGGMGAVLDTRDEKLGRSVAMKVMLRGNASDEEKQRFLQEARVLGQLAHPNIVPIHDLGTDEHGRLFYTMKLVQGVTLQDILRELKEGGKEALAKYPLNQLLTIFQKVCDAVGFAHSRGIIHRDLKPANIMVGEFGEVLVMDWGLAKILPADQVTRAWVASTPARDGGTVLFDNAATADEVALASGTGDAAPETKTFSIPQEPSSAAPSGSYATVEGAVMGTPNYMSPEQAAGQINELDARSDIFSLGAILYALLVLRSPVEGGSVGAILAKVRSADFEPPSIYSSGRSVRRTHHKPDDQRADARQVIPLLHLPGGRVPAALSSVAMKALARDRTKRYPNVTELSAEIEAFRGGFATRAEEAGAFKQLQLLMLRHKAVTASLAVLLLISIGFVWQVKVSETRAIAGEKSALEATAVAVKEQESTRRALARAQTALAEGAVREHDGKTASAALRAVPKDLRDETWAYLLARSDTSLATLGSVTTDYVSGLAAHPRHAGIFAIAGKDDWVSLVEARTGKRLLQFHAELANAKGGTYLMSFSPNGEELAVANQNAKTIAFHSTRDGRKLREWAVPEPMGIEFNPVANQVLVTPKNKGVRSDLRLHDAETGAVVWSVDPLTSWVRTAFVPSGESVVAALGQTKVLVLDARTGRETRKLPPSASYVWQIGVSPDSKLVAYGDEKGAVRCARLSDGELTLDFHAQRTVRQMHFTPESHRLVTLTYPDNRSYHRLHVWDARSGRFLHSVLGADDSARLALIHPVSGELIVAGSTTKSWGLQQSEPLWSLPSCINGPWVSFCGSGDDTLLVLEPDGSPQVTHLDPGGASTILWQEKEVECKHPVARVSSDGRFVISGSNSSPGKFVLFQIEATGVKKLALWTMMTPPGPVCLSPAADRIWTGTQVLDAFTGKEQQPFAMKVNGKLLDGHWLSATRIIATFDDKAGSTLAIADPTSGQTLVSMSHDSRILALAVAPGGKLVAEAGQDKFVRLRDAETLVVRRQFRAHDGAIGALAVHPGKPMLATVSDDFTMRLWNYETGLMLEEIRGLEVMPVSVAWSPGGRRLASTGIDRRVSVWEPRSLNVHK